MQQVRLLLWVSPPSFWVPVLVPGFSWFLPVPPGSLCSMFACGCCSESEDSLNLLRIQHSNSLCEYVSFFFFLELRVHHCALHSVHNSLLLHLANRASFTCKTDSFSWGHGPDALACKARPSSDQCGTSVSVSSSCARTTLPDVWVRSSAGTDEWSPPVPSLCSCHCEALRQRVCQQLASPNS